MRGGKRGLPPAQLHYSDLHQDNERKSGETGQGPPPYSRTHTEEGKEHPCGARAAALMGTGDMESCNLSFSVQAYERNGFTFWSLNTGTTGALPMTTRSTQIPRGMEHSSVMPHGVTAICTSRAFASIFAEYLYKINIRANL